MHIGFIVKTVCIAAVVCLILVSVVSAVLVNFALIPSGLFGRLYNRIPQEKKKATPEELVRETNKKRIDEETSDWQRRANSSEVSIRSYDGLTLRATEYRCSASSDRWLIMVHGYRTSRNACTDYAMQYSRMGYNVLTPDNRAHGKSGGKIIGMGWLDRFDILSWIRYLTTQFPQAKIVLHGVSMGGAAVMMTLGEQVPPNVVAAVEDCGYTSVKDEFAVQIIKMLHLPKFPFLPVASLISRLRCGYFFGEASSLKQLRKNRLPVLFIHGDSDTFVPSEMVYRNYDATCGDRQLLIVKSADHADSSIQDPHLYWDTVTEFLGKYVK